MDSRETRRSEPARLRDAYVEAFNRGAMEDLEGLLHPEAVYRWVAAGRAEEGRKAVMKLYLQGHKAFAGRSRLSPVPGTEDQAIWWQPESEGLKPAGLQTILTREGSILEIADEHSLDKVRAAARGVSIPE